MQILIVGNVLKDVYLSLNTKNEDFETDKHGTKWLNLGFNASSHQFFNRMSTYGGAAVSLEVLQKMNLNATICGSNFEIDDNGPSAGPADVYRYILTAGDGASYLVPTEFRRTNFVQPETEVDYIYIDRSAELDSLSAGLLIDYLDNFPGVKLVVYLRDKNDLVTNLLARRADLVFSEDKDVSSAVYLSKEMMSYRGITKNVKLERIDVRTHLSVYSVMAATILAGFLMEKPIEDCLEMARLNVENASLDSVLSLSEIEGLMGSNYNTDEDLRLIAANLMLPGKGILATDESAATIKKRFVGSGIIDTPESRHAYRNLLYTTPEIEDYLNGIILCNETVHDFTEMGQPYPDYLISRRIIPGVKADQGLEKIVGSEETFTRGLDDLSERLRGYYEMGLRFAKWRAVFEIRVRGDGSLATPTDEAIEGNCRIMAEFARTAQSAGLVPVVEPEVLFRGNYTIEQNKIATSKILRILFASLYDYGVDLKACILKIHMIQAGELTRRQSTFKEVSETTAEVLKKYVPEELAGVVFLSGGQTPERTTVNFDAILKNGPYPWPVSFSFARALQDPALYTWKGRDDREEAAQKAFKKRLIANKKVLDDYLVGLNNN